MRRGTAVASVRAGAVTLESGEVLEAESVVSAAGDRAMALLPDPAFHDQVRPRKGHLAITERGFRLTRHQVAELDYITGSDAARTTMAENYIGLAF